MEESYIAIIGSVARQDHSNVSDIDICRINCNDKVRKQENWPNGPINYIDYDTDTFLHLYKHGSLFIYHILNEGVLIEGNQNTWEMLKEEFSVTDDFKKEIEDLLEINRVFENINIFGNQYLSLYSNLYTNIKNFSIFHLANKGVYIFNKERAIKKVFGDYYFDLLLDAYNYFERGILMEKKDFYCRKDAACITNYYLSRMEELTK